MNKCTFPLLVMCLLAGIFFYHCVNALPSPDQGQINCIALEKSAVGIGNSDKNPDTIIVPDGFYVPNIITPNGDGINDVLTISCSSVSNFDMQIFNREGIEIFQSSSIEISWDGRTNAGVMVSDGTYYYILRATTATGENWNKAGFITVLGSRSGGNQ